MTTAAWVALGVAGWLAVAVGVAVSIGLVVRRRDTQTPTTPDQPDHAAAAVGLAWHDVTCPEAAGCRDRALHAASNPLERAGVLAAFLDRHAQLSTRPKEAP